MARSNRVPATPATRALQNAGVAFEPRAYSHDPRTTDYGAEAVELLGVQAERVFKTLIVRFAPSERNRSGAACAVIPVERRLSTHELGAVLGEKGIELADPAFAERRTGYVVGGISPIGQRTPVPTVIDESAWDHGTVLVSGGRRGFDLELAPEDLRRVLDARSAAITA